MNIPLHTQNHEAQKVASWNAKLMKIEEASRKKNELNQEFICHAKDSLVSKMEQTEEKRDAIISDKLEKIKVRISEFYRFFASTVVIILPPTDRHSTGPHRRNQTKQSLDGTATCS